MPAAVGTLGVIRDGAGGGFLGFVRRHEAVIVHLIRTRRETGYPPRKFRFGLSRIFFLLPNVCNDAPSPPLPRGHSLLAGPPVKGTSMRVRPSSRKTSLDASPHPRPARWVTMGANRRRRVSVMQESTFRCFSLKYQSHRLSGRRGDRADRQCAWRVLASCGRSDCDGRTYCKYRSKKKRFVGGKKSTGPSVSICRKRKKRMSRPPVSSRARRRRRRRRLVSFFLAQSYFKDTRRSLRRSTEESGTNRRRRLAAALREDGGRRRRSESCGGEGSDSH